jgi:hypothetical protein
MFDVISSQTVTGLAGMFIFNQKIPTFRHPGRHANRDPFTRYTDTDRLST